jgi:hypothetical protein
VTGGLSPDAPAVLDSLPLVIDPAEVLRFQGYKRGSLPEAAVLALLDEALELGRRLIAPRAVVRWLAVSGQEADRLELATADGATAHAVTIPGIGQRWGPLAAVAAAVCTIGPGLEGRVAELFEARELPLAVMLDSVGSGAVESLAECVNDLLCQQATPLGWRATNRISPGYGDWDVGDQRLLFRLCPGDRAAVHLNDACFMSPVKSISLLVGAGPAARVDHYFSQCARCWKGDCPYRRTPARATVHRGTAETLSH